MDDNHTTTTAKPAVERAHAPDWLMHVVNPVVRKLVQRRRGGLAVLEFTGRRTGKPYTAGSQRTCPSTALAYGSSSSFARGCTATRVGVMRAMDAIAVALARPDPGKEPVPHEPVHLGQHHPPPGAAGVEPDLDASATSENNEKIVPTPS